MTSSESRLESPVTIVALCGSLRSASINAAVLRAAARLARSDVRVAIHPSLGELPLFNPDLEAAPPAAAERLRVAIGAADALLIASPEYAHGVSGTIKNALDWLVSFEPFMGKPVAVLNASPRAHHADDALRETLRTMSATLVGETSFAIPLLGARLDEAGIATSPEVAGLVAQVLEALRAAIEQQGAANAAPARP